MVVSHLPGPRLDNRTLPGSLQSSWGNGMNTHYSTGTMTTSGLKTVRLNFKKLIN